MAKEKVSFVMFYEWETIFDRLSDAQLGALLRAIYAYEIRGEEYTGTDDAVRMSLAFVCPALDRNKAKYLATCKQNSRNAKKRWDTPRDRANGRDRMQSDATACEPMRTDAKHADYDYEYDSDYDRDYDRESDRDARARGRYRPPTAEAVREYVKAHGLRVDVERYMGYYRARNWRTANGKPVDWQARLRQWDDGPAEQPDRTTEERAAENRQYLEQTKALLRRMREEDTEEDDNGQAD